MEGGKNDMRHFLLVLKVVKELKQILYNFLEVRIVASKTEEKNLKNILMLENQQVNNFKSRAYENYQ